MDIGIGAPGDLSLVTPKYNDQELLSHYRELEAPINAQMGIKISRKRNANDKGQIDIIQESINNYM